MAEQPAAKSPAADETGRFEVELWLDRGYEFGVRYRPGGGAELVVDEFPPIGAGRGPNPSRLLATAVAHCLASSFLFCVRKARIEPAGLRVMVEGTTVRNERGRLRIGSLSVRLLPQVAAQDRVRLARCLEIFEDFCVVTQSVRHGLPVTVEVQPQS